MQKKGEFYTLHGYRRRDGLGMSEAMEDYLEMICRLNENGQTVRVNKLASLLNVTPPSASKMLKRLREQDMVEFEPYGFVLLTAKGKEYGAYLLKRHAILQRFFCYVNASQDELELVEKIEHFIDEKTVLNLETLLENLQRQYILYSE